jgi:hypothetical protein
MIAHGMRWESQAAAGCVSVMQKAPGKRHVACVTIRVEKRGGIRGIGRV